MNYMFLVAGVGSRLQPLTNMTPKCLYKLDDNTTILQRMINLIRKYDEKAFIIVVDGFKRKLVEESVKGVDVFVQNPFFKDNNSIASVWMAKDYLNTDMVIFDGDTIYSEKLVKEIICKKPQYSAVLVDTGIKNDGDYNVTTIEDRVVVMSKELLNYTGESACVMQVAKKDLELFIKHMDMLIDEGYYKCWYEDVFNQMIFKDNFKLHYIDIKDYEWTEIDSVNDLARAKEIK